MDSFGEQKSIIDAFIHLYSLPQEGHWGPWVLCRLPLPVSDLFQKFKQLNHNRKYHNTTRERNSYFLFSWESIAMLAFSLNFSVERGKEQTLV